MRLYILIVFLPAFVLGCLPGYEKELRYLYHYLGIQPHNQGQIPSNGMFLKKISCVPPLLYTVIVDCFAVFEVINRLFGLLLIFFCIFILSF